MTHKEITLEVNIAPASVDAVGERYTQDTEFHWVVPESDPRKPVYLFHGYAPNDPRRKQAKPKPAGEVLKMTGWKCREDDPTSCGHYAEVRITDDTEQGRRLIAEHESGKQLYGSLGRWNPLSRVSTDGRIEVAHLVELSLQTDDMGLPPANFHARAYQTVSDLKTAGLNDLASLFSEREQKMLPTITAEWLVKMMGALNLPVNPLAGVLTLEVDPVTGLYTAEALKTLEEKMQGGFDLYSKYTREKTMNEANEAQQAQTSEMQALISRLQGEMTILKTAQMQREADDWAQPRFLDPTTRKAMADRYVELARHDELMLEHAATLKTAAPTVSALKLFSESHPILEVVTPPTRNMGNGGDDPTRPTRTITQTESHVELKIHVPDYRPAPENDGVKSGLELIQNARV